VQAIKAGLDDFSSNVLAWGMKYAVKVKRMSFHNHGSKFNFASNAKLIIGKRPLLEFIEDVRSTMLNKADNQPFRNDMLIFCMSHSFDTVGPEVAKKFWSDVLSLSDVREDGTIIEQKNAARQFRKIIYDAYMGRATSWWSYDSEKRRYVARLYQAAINNWALQSFAKLKPEEEFEWTGDTIKSILAMPTKKARRSFAKSIVTRNVCQQTA
jgi:hypothetical protein